MPRRAVALALPLALLLPASAAAVTVPLTDGRTAIGLDSATGLTADARLLRVTGSRLDPVTGKGVVAHRRADRLVLRAGDRVLRLPAVRVTTSGPSPRVVAGTGKSRTTLFLLRRLRVTRDGPDGAVRAELRLTARGAALLRRRLGTDLRPGRRMGTAGTSFTVASLAITGGRSTLTLDPPLARRLAESGVTVTPTAGATVPAPGAFAFPITEGDLARTTAQGFLRHGGGLRFAGGGRSLELTAPVVTTVPGDRRVVLGSPFGPVAALDLDLAGARDTLVGRSVTITGVTARLSAVAADALNRAFGTTAFAAGTLVGTYAAEAEAQ